MDGGRDSFIEDATNVLDREVERCTNNGGFLKKGVIIFWGVDVANGML